MSYKEDLEIKIVEADLEIKRQHADLLKAQAENERARTASIQAETQNE